MANILLVDPSITARLLAVTGLEEAGHHVEETMNGREAIDICIENPPDCMIMELVLQELDGFKVLRALQEANLDVPAVVLTDLRMKSLEEKCRELGAVAFLRKPMAASLLTQRIEEILAERPKPELVESEEADPKKPKGRRRTTPRSS